MERSPPRELGGRSIRAICRNRNAKLPGEMMSKNKIIAAEILSICVLALSVPAMASNWAYSDANYSGRYSCRLNSTGSNTSATYVVQANGRGAYTAGEMYLNQDPSDVCVFTLETWGPYASAYWVDSAFGVVEESLTWLDESWPAGYL